MCQSSSFPCISSGETAQALWIFPTSRLQVFRGVHVLATNIRILVIFAHICIMITCTQKHLIQLMCSVTEYYLLPSTKIFFTFTSLVFGGVLLIKQTKYEFKRDVNELLHAFELAKNGKHTSFISTLILIKNWLHSTNFGSSGC